MSMISISLSIICLIIGLVIGIAFMRYMSSFNFDKFERIFEEQISQFQASLESLSQQYLDFVRHQHESNENNIANLNHNLSAINKQVIDLHQIITEFFKMLNRVKN